MKKPGDTAKSKTVSKVTTFLVVAVFVFKKTKRTNQNKIQK